MRELTSFAIFSIVCLYVFIGSLYIYNKDYTSEKAEVSTVKSGDDDTIVIFVPKYLTHLKMPKKEWNGQNEFILQKNYSTDSISDVYVGIPMLVSALNLILVLFLIIIAHDEFSLWE